ncbi:uncharacterized protein LOC107840608 isoform X2 [Capsicum annuum]|uniref:uncharacterized protein LOC107840608 isoform X2 n=1 Tax=Capsicum annuum TaxID=4072 RepID=UPI001FB10209|nr:uncharacterized protein LOC107840608 isoform X2 [Capsicum annuum]
MAIAPPLTLISSGSSSNRLFNLWNQSNNMFKQIFSIADAALNKVSWPVAFAIRKAAEGNPDIQQVFAQAAKIGLVYYNSGKSREELLLERVEKLEQRKNAEE